MFILNVVGTIGAMVAGHGASKIAKEALKNVTPETTTKIAKICVDVGKSALVGATAVVAYSHVKQEFRKVDLFIEGVKKTVKKTKEKIKDSETKIVEERAE